MDITPQEREALEGLLRKAKAERDAWQARVDVFMEQLGYPSEGRRVRKKPTPKGLLAIAELRKRTPPELEYDKLVEELNRAGAGDNVKSMKGGPKTAIVKGINWYLKHGYLERVRGNVIRITHKGSAHFEAEKQHWPI